MAEEMTIEQSFEQLEEIIDKMQETDVTLEDSFALYEQGMKMIQECNRRIDEVEKKMLVMNEAGELTEL